MTEQHTDTHTDSYTDFDVAGFTRQVIAEFRANDGKVGGMFEGSTLALLTTTGARSGLPRTNPLGYLVIDGRPVVIASAMGAANHPAWYHNIRRHPMVTVEFGTETFQAAAGIPTGAERDRLFAAVVEQEPGYGEYQAKTSRVIPVVTLHRVEPGPGADWVRGMGDFVVEVHDWLRQELVELRRRVDLIVEGDTVALQRPPGDLAQEMRKHCLEFCGALTKHHTGEDAGAFPMLAQRFPALAPALTTLGEEHAVVARLQAEIKDLVEGYAPGESNPVLLRANLESLASQLEAHFAYEERTIVTALNTVAPAPY